MPLCVSIFVACVQRQGLITDIILLLIYMYLSLKRKRRGRFFLFKYLKTWLWHPDMPTLLRWSWYFYTTDDAIETWITNKNMKQRKKRFTKSCLSEKKEKFFLRANAWICSDIYLRGYNYRHLFIKMASSTDLSKN